MCRGVLAGDVRTVTPSVHHKKRSVSVAEVEVVLALDGRIIISVGIIKAECIHSVRKRLLRAISLADEVVNDLESC